MKGVAAEYQPAEGLAATVLEGTGGLEGVYLSLIEAGIRLRQVRHGDVAVHTDGQLIELAAYHVLPVEQVFQALYLKAGVGVLAEFVELIVGDREFELLLTELFANQLQGAGVALDFEKYVRTLQLGIYVSRSVERKSQKAYPHEVEEFGQKHMPRNQKYLSGSIYGQKRNVKRKNIIQNKLRRGGGLPEWINKLKCGDMEGVGFGGGMWGCRAATKRLRAIHQFEALCYPEIHLLCFRKSFVVDAF